MCTNTVIVLQIVLSQRARDEIAESVTVPGPQNKTMNSRYDEF